jgi:hypothetical protein
MMNYDEFKNLLRKGIAKGIINPDQASRLVLLINPDCKCEELGYVRCYCDDRCSFCNSEGVTIHPYSVQQFGEPVCVPCFNTTMRADPTND